VETLLGLNSRSGKAMSLVFLLDLIIAIDWGTQFSVSSNKCVTEIEQKALLELENNFKTCQMIIQEGKDDIQAKRDKVLHLHKVVNFEGETYVSNGTSLIELV
jgi:hypothetical protein